MENREFQRVAKALSDPRRFAILEAIHRAREISCGQLAALFPVGQSTVSHHVGILEAAGLVAVRRQGQHAFFSSRPETLQAYLKELQKRLPLSASAEGEKGGIP